MHRHLMIDEFIGLTGLHITVEHQDAAEIVMLQDFDGLVRAVFTMQHPRFKRQRDAQFTGSFTPPRFYRVRR